MKNTLYAGVAACSIALSSCGENKEAEAALASKDTLAPIEAAELFKKDVAEGNVASTWDALPAKYQSDVEGLAHTFAGNIDPEVYNETVTTLTALNNLLISKKSIFIEIIKEQAKGEIKEETLSQMDANWDVVTELTTSLLNSDIKDIESLKTLDISKMTSAIQPNVQKLLTVIKAADESGEFKKFLDSKIEAIASEGETASVKFTIEGEDAETIELVKVENRWLPTDMVTDWTKEIEKSQKALDGIKEMPPMQKTQMMSGIKTLQTAIEQLEKANSKDEMMKEAATLGAQFGPMIGILMSQL